MRGFAKSTMIVSELRDLRRPPVQTIGWEFGLSTQVWENRLLDSALLRMLYAARRK
jgi:hypothetical protein